MVFKKTSLVTGMLLVSLMVAMGLAAFGCGGQGGSGSLSEGSGEDVALVYTYAAGDSWEHEVTTVSNGSIEGFEDEGGAVAETTKSRMTTTVQEVADDGTATLQTTYEVLEMTSNGQTVDLTGQEPTEATMTVDRTGKVISMEGLDETAAGSDLFSSGMPFDPSDLSGQFSSLTFPVDGTAKVGEEWESSATVPMAGLGEDITATTKAKLTAVASENGRQVATIDFTTSVPMDLTLDLGAMLQEMLEGMGGAAGMGMSPEDLAFVMTMKGDIGLPGTAKVDLATGQEISMDSNGTMDIEMEITEAPELLVPSDQRGPFKMNMTVTITVVEVK